MKESTAGYILDVKRIELIDRDWGCKCPHCKHLVTFPTGPVRGEQFNCNRCQEWFAVTSDAKFTPP